MKPAEFTTIEVGTEKKDTFIKCGSVLPLITNTVTVI